MLQKYIVKGLMIKRVVSPPPGQYCLLLIYCQIITL